MAKEFMFRGKSLEELQQMDMEAFIKLLPSRERRSLTRGMSHEQKKLLEAITKQKKKIKTHAREMVIVPVMVGKTINVYSGKEWMPILIEADMLGHRLGEFAMTRKKVAHSAPGVGATRSSAALSVR